MINITPVEFPIIGTATKMEVLILNFKTDATSASTYYELFTDDGKRCLEGNYTLTQAQYDAWGADNAYVEQAVASHIGVTII